MDAPAAHILLFVTVGTQPSFRPSSCSRTCGACAKNTMALIHNLSVCMGFDGASGGQMMKLRKIPFTKEQG
eukprot:867223-Pelagomonas_calceolata.AAC.10